MDPENPKGALALESLELTKQWIRDGSKYRVVNAGSDINSKADDFAPFLKGKKNEELYFTSSREGVLGKNTNHITGQYFTDIFIITKSKDKRSRKRSTKTITPPEWDKQTLSNQDTLGLDEVVNLKNFLFGTHTVKSTSPAELRKERSALQERQKVVEAKLATKCKKRCQDDIQKMIDLMNTDNIPESHLSCENCAYARQRSVIDVLLT